MLEFPALESEVCATFVFLLLHLNFLFGAAGSLRACVLQKLNATMASACRQLVPSGTTDACMRLAAIESGSELVVIKPLT